MAGRDGAAKGRITELSGRILDTNGRSLPNLRIEIWQCDANGRYRHPHDPGNHPVDENFQGHGHAVTNADGRYRFRTIHPVPYPGRTPHIHVAVFPEGRPAFVTQLYVAGEARNGEDFLFRRIPVERRHLVTVPFLPDQGRGSHMSATFDIVLGPAGTPTDSG